MLIELNVLTNKRLRCRVTVFLAVIGFETFQQGKLTRVSVTDVPVLKDL